MGIEVIQETTFGQLVKSVTARSPYQAITKAMKLASEVVGDDAVYIQVARDMDGQISYLNPGERWNLSGKDWVTSYREVMEVSQ